ncbi:MAG TPA: hypothetical protein VKA47_09460 [Solirubrobacterales bacterium]|nr:hypothetical protein [Solirubrobacterales bacterium]
MSGPLAGRDTSILARYPGTCEACGLVHRGDSLVRDGSWIHERCFEEREDAARLMPTDEVDAGPDPDEEGWPR